MFYPMLDDIYPLDIYPIVIPFEYYKYYMFPIYFLFFLFIRYFVPYVSDMYPNSYPPVNKQQTMENHHFVAG